MLHKNNYKDWENWFNSNNNLNTILNNLELHFSTNEFISVTIELYKNSFGLKTQPKIQYFVKEWISRYYLYFLQRKKLITKNEILHRENEYDQRWVIGNVNYVKRLKILLNKEQKNHNNKTCYGGVTFGFKCSKHQKKLI